MRLLFWNIHRQEPLTQLRNLCRHHAPDVLGLAECLLSPATVLAAINADQRGPYRLVTSGVRVQVYARNTLSTAHLIAMDDRYLGLCTIEAPNVPTILLGIVHLRSALYADEDTRKERAAGMVRSIEAQEARLEHRRTIVIGDFNMRPHETGLSSFFAFNTTPYRDVLERTGGRRRLHGQEKPFFYGPLPRIEADPLGLSPRCSGSYFKTLGQSVEPYWHPLDRVLVRPDLADRFSDDQIQVLTYDGVTPLIRRNGVPDLRISDHLPIRLDIALEEV